MNIIYPVIAFIAGAGMSVQTAINSRLSDGIGGQPIIASLMSFVVGLICLLVLSFFCSDWQVATVNMGSQSTWRWLGGAIGAVIVFTSVILAQKLGVANTMFIFVTGQLVMGMLIDSYGLIEMPRYPLHWWKVAGMSIMLVGLVLFVFGDRWLEKV